MRYAAPKPMSGTVWAANDADARATVRSWFPGRRIGWMRPARYKMRPVRPRDGSEFGAEKGTKFYCFKYVVR